MRILYQPHQYTQQRQREKKRWIWPVHLAMEATYHRDRGDTVVWDKQNPSEHYDKIISEPEGIPFLELPAPDRGFTNAHDIKYQNNGNFKFRPGTYIQSAAGCWWGKCVFCKECGRKYEQRSVGSVIDEIEVCKRQGFKEIFDDAASFPSCQYRSMESWRDYFIRKLKPIGIKYSCNMRFGTAPDFAAMKDAGFRMLLYGLESANKGTLNQIHKGIDLDKALKELCLAASHGLEPHVAYMVSYPWETLEEEMQTIDLVRYLLKKGIVKTAQCSVYFPSQGKMNRDKAYLTRELYKVALMPEFWCNKIKDIKNLDDWKYLLRSIKEGLWGRK